MRGETVADPTDDKCFLEIDRSSAKVTRGFEQVRLTPTEWHILDVLAANYGKLVTQRQLLADVGIPATKGRGTTYVVHMAALRRKLSRNRASVHLLTEPGLGYWLVRRCNDDFPRICPPRAGHFYRKRAAECRRFALRSTSVTTLQERKDAVTALGVPALGRSAVASVVRSTQR